MVGRTHLVKGEAGKKLKRSFLLASLTCIAAVLQGCRQDSYLVKQPQLAQGWTKLQLQLRECLFL